MRTKHGSLSIHSENIFPIIKKWMYSDQDIFVREMVSNASDAITKRRKLALAGECELPEDYKPEIKVIVNDKDKTLTFIDNGLGMTADEVKEYITQIAFSGAAEFLEKYKDKADEDQIIGHFGLGFYSAFMVADMVHIETLSFTEGAESVHWECDGSTEYEMRTGHRDTVGTEITLFLNEEALAFANEYKVREVLEKYCSFIPYEIYLENPNADPKYDTIPEEELLDTDTVIEHIHEDAKTEERENENGEKETVEISPASDKVKILARPVPVNDIHPLWTKHPNECTDEEYKEFYRKVFRDYKEPLFWIHLNMDYPFNLKGILYFPKINMEFESIEGTIKLYNNQVFIADNIKEVIPEYLLLLKGVIDCPDLPLNVSRSALQNDGFVTKISDYISKKVADKLTGMCKTKRDEFEKYWDDIHPFIKFGCLKDEKFSGKLMDFILFKDLDGKYFTLKELTDAEKEGAEADAEKKEEAKAGEAGTEENGTKEAGTEENVTEETGTDTTAEEKKEADTEDGSDEKKQFTVYYVTDVIQQSQYINLFKEQNKRAVILNSNIDAPFITHVERVREDVKFRRIDAEVSDELKNDENEDTELKEKMEKLFRRVLENEQLEVCVENLRNEDVAAMVVYSEESRRMQDMMKMYAAPGMDVSMFGAPPTVVLNARHPLVQYLSGNGEGELSDLITRQLYDLALISNQPLQPEAMTEFVKRSSEIMQRLTK